MHTRKESDFIKLCFALRKMVRIGSILGVIKAVARDTSMYIHSLIHSSSYLCIN
jgi:hypothetical protein